MWFGVEPLLSLLVLSLPILWIIDWRYCMVNETPNPLPKFLSIYVLTILSLIVFQGVIGHLHNPQHLHAVLWGISNSIFNSVLHFSYGPEGRLIFLALFYWMYLHVRTDKPFRLHFSVYSIPLLPLIGVGTSAQAFAPVSDVAVSIYSPIPTIYPLIFSLFSGILLAECIIRTVPLILAKKISIFHSRFVVILWIFIAIIISIKDSISSLSPSNTALSLIFFSSIMILSDIIGGVSETLPESQGETWPSLAFTFLSITIALFVINMFSSEVSLYGIGIIGISTVLGSQLPTLGFDNRNRSAHRWSILGTGIASILLISFGSLDDFSIKIITGTILFIPISWNIVDRYSRFNELRD